MISISVKQAIKDLHSAKDQLGDKQFNIAVSRAINETLLQGRTEARSAVKALYNIPQRYLNGIQMYKSFPSASVNNRNLSGSTLTGFIKVDAKPIPMDAFSPKFETASMGLTISKKGLQKQRSFKKAKSNPGMGVSIEVIKGHREIIPYAFMIPGAKPRVFARGEYKSGSSYGFVQRHKRLNSGGTDTPIKPLLSVTVHAAVINKQAQNKLETRVSNVFPVSIERNISYLLSRVGT